MARVTFRNVLDTESEFRDIQEDSLLAATYEYARTSSDEMYECILEERVTLSVNGSIIEVENWKDTNLTETDEVVITPQIEGKASGFIQVAIGALLIAVTIAFPALWPTWAFYPMIGIGASIMLGGISNLLFTPDLPTLSSMGGAKETQTYNWTGISTIAKTDSPVPIVYGTHMVGGNIISIFTEVEGDDNYLYMLLALCEGEIEGICQHYNRNSTCSTTDQDSSDYRDPAIYFNDQPVKDYNNFEWWYRNGSKTPGSGQSIYDPDYQTSIPGFDGVRLQYDDGRDVPPESDPPSESDGIIYTTTTSVDSVILQLKAPALYKIEEGKIKANDVIYKIQFKTENEVTYHNFEASKWGPLITKVGNFNTKYTDCKFKDTKYIYGDNPPKTYRITVLKNNFDPNYFDDHTPDPDIIGYVGSYTTIHEYALDLNIELLDDSGNTIGIHSQPSIKQIAQQKYYGSYYSDESTPGVTTYTKTGGIEHTYSWFFLGMLMVQLTHNANTSYQVIVGSTEIAKTMELILNGTSKDSVWGIVGIDFNEESGGSGNDVYNIKIIRTDGGPSTELDVQNNLVLSSVTEVIDGKYIYPHTALMGFKIKATGQLSGSPPNVTTLVKGRKIQVPALSGSEAFDLCYWDDTYGRWEYDTSIRTWNETFYETEFSCNSMLVVRDLLTDTRVGLGSYITTSDLYTSGVIETIKRCHKQWLDPSDTDFFAWWDEPEYSIRAGYFGDGEHVRNDGRNTITFKVNAHSNKYIRLSRSAIYDPSITTTQQANIYFLPSNKLILGNEYTFDITLSTTRSDSNSYMDFYVFTDWMHGSYKGTGANLTGKKITPISSGTHSITFTCPLDGVKIIGVKFSQRNMYITITNIELTEDKRENYHTFNGVIESEQSALTALTEMCGSFRCWPLWINGKFNFVIDEDDTPVHTLSKSNTTEFSQSFTPLSEIPYKLVAQFTDKDNNYNMRSIIGRSTSTSLVKLNERTIGLKGITNRKKAERELVFKLNKVTNCTHVVNMKCGLDSIHATAGDIVYVQDDLPSWGYSGRVARSDVTSKLIVIDQNYTLDPDETDIIRYQVASNLFMTGTINSIANSREITLVNWVGTPCSDAVYTLGYGESVTPKKFRLLSVSRSNENEVEVTGLEHISSLYDATNITIEPDKPALPIPTKPSPPKSVSVTQLDITTGIGFSLHATAPEGKDISEIVVSMSGPGNGGSNDPCLQGTYRHIATIPTTNPHSYYIDNNLTLDKTYYFRFFCRTFDGRESEPVLVVFELKSNYYSIPAPTGIKLKGAGDNSQEFNSKDVTILWNPVKLTSGSAYIKGYKVEVYKIATSGDDEDEMKLVRTVYRSSTEFPYTYEMNAEDGGEDDDCDKPDSEIYFAVYTVLINGIESNSSDLFKVTNPAPGNITNVTAISILKGVNFSWDSCPNSDFRHYSIQHKVSSGEWSDEINVNTNSYSRILTSDEISTYTATPSIYIKVKAVDWYDQSSTDWTDEVSANAGKVSDNIFGLVATKSSGTGDVSLLYNGELTTQGVTFS